MESRFLALQYASYTYDETNSGLRFIRWMRFHFGWEWVAPNCSRTFLSFLSFWLLCSSYPPCPLFSSNACPARHCGELRDKAAGVGSGWDWKWEVGGKRVGTSLKAWSAVRQEGGNRWVVTTLDLLGKCVHFSLKDMGLKNKTQPILSLQCQGILVNN